MAPTLAQRSTRRSFGARLLAAVPVAVAAGVASGCMPRRPSTSGFAGAGGARPFAVAPGVYMLRGAPGEPDVANQGRIGNAGFLVGPNGVVAVDTGTSYAEGVELLRAIASITDQPVRQVVLTHTRQEFLFGAAAYRERGIPIVMHRRAAQLMRARCDRCLKNLKRLLGDEAMRGSIIVDPDVQIDTSAALNDAGRPVRLVDFGHSSGPGDLAVCDVPSGAVFAGGLIDVLRIPDVQDADLDGWHAALRQFADMPPATVIPGHGPAADLHLATAAVGSYLRQLEARVRGLLDDGAALSDVPRSVELPAYADWDGYATVHRRNAAVLFVRFERAQLG